MREGEGKEERERERVSCVKDEKSKRIKNVKFMHRGFCFTYGTLCVYFTLWHEGGGVAGLIHGTYLCTTLLR